MSEPRILDLLDSLPPRHQEALRWFLDRAGQLVPWPEPLPGGTLLATRAKGIYKPQWSEFALSVRQTLDGPYPDLPIQENPDGSWSYKYYQEGLDVDDRDQAFTNRGLLNCWKQVVPVGVMIQVAASPAARYRVMGLALVVGYEEGYFCFEGVSPSRVTDVDRTMAIRNALSTAQERADLIAGVFDLSMVEEARHRTIATIVVRQGQAGFRRTLLKAYSRQCAVTAYDVEDALDAAHIIPYRGPMTNHPSNGLLLRSDIHSLFDYGLLSVDVETSNCRVILSSDIRRSAYESLHGTSLQLPREPMLRPSIVALRKHRELAGI